MEYTNQVGGRAKITKVLDDHLLKPTTVNEVNNYMCLPRLVAEVAPDICFVVSLEDIIPLKMCNACSNSFHSIQDLMQARPKGYYLIMKDAAHDLQKPRLMDLKLGTRTYSDYITEERKQHHIRKALRNTTSRLGVRMCGASFHGATEGKIIKWSKAWGKEMSSEEFSMAMKAFFNVSEPQKRDTILQLRKIKTALESCPGFRFFGASLLAVLDDLDGKTVIIKMIDFASMARSELGQPQYEGPDDGALFGVNNMLSILED
uniref:Kinase n=1 Tax=Caenorhabditis tropicalis TaxID=1561998 RepID=A0A1I7TZ64_9PELO